MNKMPHWKMRKIEAALEIYRHAARLLQPDRETILSSIPKAANMDMSIQIGAVSSPVEATVLLLNIPLPKGPNSGLDELVREIIAGVDKALKVMTPRERDLITLRYLAPIRLNRQQVCVSLGISPRTYDLTRLKAFHKISGALELESDYA